MAFVSVEKNGQEKIFDSEPIRFKYYGGYWGEDTAGGQGIEISLPKGTIEKLIGKKLTWEDEPVELKEEQ